MCEHKQNKINLHEQVSSDTAVLKICMSNTHFALGPEHFLHEEKQISKQKKLSIAYEKRKGNMYSKEICTQKS